jgi:hypothetical protein
MPMSLFICRLMCYKLPELNVKQQYMCWANYKFKNWLEEQTERRCITCGRLISAFVLV